MHYKIIFLNIKLHYYISNDLGFQMPVYITMAPGVVPYINKAGAY